MTIDPQRIVQQVLASLLLIFYFSPISSAQDRHSLSTVHPAEPARTGAIRQVFGETAEVRVPMVSEPWTATVGRVAASEPHEIPDFGQFPGAREWKRQANARRQARQVLLEAQPPIAPAPNGLRFTEAPQLNAPSQSVVFDGPSESDSHLVPPDPQLAAGPNSIVVAVNSLLAIYDKSGSLVGSFQNLSSFFSSLGVTGQIFDPRIIYDQADQRFILSAGEIDFTGLTNGHVLLAVSATDDPTGVWNKFAIDSKGRNAANTADTFPDFPGLGLSPSAVYISTNQFPRSQQGYSQFMLNC